MSPQIATNTRVELADLLDFIRARRHAVLLTPRLRSPTG
jgi:hypothetical protein